MEVKEPSAKYLARPRYKQTEIGLIPEDWEVSKLGIHATFRTGPFGSALHQSDYVDDGVPVINPMQIVDGKIQATASMAVSEQAARKLSEFRLSAGNVIIGRRGEMGRCAFVRNEEQGWLCGTGSMIIRTAPSLDARFLQRVLSSPPVIAEIENASVGSTMINLNQATLGNLLVPLPPTKFEQEAIADALSDADAIVESLEQLLAKNRQVKQGAMQELLTGKRRLPGFGVEWETKQVGEFAECTSGGTPSTLMPNYWNGSVRWMSSGELNLKAVYEVEGRITEEGLRNSSAKMIPANCVLIGLAGQGKTRGTVAMNRVGLCTNQSIAAILPNTAFNSKYLYYNLDARYRELRDLSTGGGGRGGLNLKIIKSLAVLFPKLSEQTAIGSTLSDMDAGIAAIEARLAKARQIKQSMMQELLTGRIRLAQPGANVVQLSTRKELASALAKSHNWQINEAVVISVLAKNFGTERFPLGRKRCAKLSYLLHRHVEHSADGYLKKAAGPYNPAVKYKGPEGIAQRNRYVRPHRSGQYTGFIAGENIAQAEAYFAKWYGDEVLMWLEQFRLKTNDELELLATVDMAMVDLRNANKAAQLANVKKVIRDHPEWEAKLDRAVFSDDKISHAMKSCQQLFGTEG